MMSLFSSFDMKFFSICVTSSMVMAWNLLNNIFVKTKINMMLKKLTNSMNFFTHSLKPKMYSKFFMLYLVTMMMMWMICNSISVFPFVFPITSQLNVVMSVTLVAWISMNIYSIKKNLKGTLSHMTPQGTPYPLLSFLFIIELISNMIRPLTVTVRLMANILAGHVMMILLSKLVTLNIYLLPLYVMLNVVEFAVALIQAYIFCTMMTLYHSEI